MRNIVLLYIFSLVILGCASNNSNNNDKASLYYGQGTDDLINGRYTEALRNLTNANNLKPNNSQIMNNLGMAYFFKKDQEKAIEFIKKSIEEDPKNTDAKVNLATIYLNRNELKLAEKLYHEILKDLTFGAHFKTYYNLGIIANKRGQSKIAIEYFNKAVNENENFCPGYYELGNIHFENAQYEQALKDYRSAGMGLCFNNAEPFLKQADTLIKLHRYTEARLKLEDVHKRFLTTKFEEIARNKLKELNTIEGLHETEQFGQSGAENRDISSPSF